MNTGEFTHGFIIKQIRTLSEYDARFYIMEHVKSGAELLWIDREEQNKSFGIAFKTVPENDTGVFHILEHSVLNGSDKFPVKEPFVELLKSSLNTFLNAMTFPDKTVYPVSSRNDTDFKNLVEVYLDAVFHPAIYHNANIFRQEGWHLEMHADGSAPVYKGVVFNEMKGALSSPEDRLLLEMQRMIYGDTCYGFESGGDPVSIPNLTYEQFIATHRKFYHPSNSRIFLDGNVNMEEILTLIDSYLSEQPKLEVNFEIPYVNNIGKEKKTFYEISPEEDTSDKTYYAWGKTIGIWKDKNKITAFKVLSDYLAGSNEAPVKKAVVGAGLAEDVDFSINDEIAQPYICVTVRNASSGTLNNIKNAIVTCISDCLKSGFDREMLSASISKLEFSALDMQEPRGLILGISSLSSWLYGGDPLYYLEYRDMFQFLRDMLESDYYENLSSEFFPDENSCILTMEPSQDLGRISEDEERKRIESRLLSGGEIYRKQIIDETSELEEWQAKPDSKEQLATIPHLNISEISREPIEYKVDRGEIDGTEVWKHPSPSKEISTICFYFNMQDLELTDMPFAAFTRVLLGKIKTRKHSAAEIEKLIKMHIGKVSFGSMAATETSTGAVTPRMTVTVSALNRELAASLDIIREILMDSDFSDDKVIRDILAQTCTDIKRGLSESGHATAMTRALANLSGEAAFSEYSGNIAAFDALSVLNANFEDNKCDFAKFAENFMKQMVCSKRLIISVTGQVDDALLRSFVHSLSEGSLPQNKADLKCSFSAAEGFVIPAGISYAAMAYDYKKLGYSLKGSMQVLASFLTYEYLWNEVRVKGGAYGTGIRFDTKGVQFYSYRDPNAFSSLSVYRNAGSFIRKFFENGMSAEKYIVGTIGSSEPVVTPAEAATIADRFIFRGISTEERRKRRGEMLDTTSDDLLSLADLLDEVGKQANICVIGSKSIIDTCKPENLSVRNISEN